MADYDCYVRIVPPITIWDDNLTFSNVTEEDYVEYDELTEYEAGERVIIKTGVHKIYRSTTTQIGNYPPDSLTTWIDEGKTNKFRMFDMSVNSATTRDDLLNVSVTPSGYINAIVLMELFGEYVEVEATSTASGVVYRRTIQLQDYTDVTDWYQYFYFEFLRFDAMILTDLPAYDDLTIQVSVYNEGGVCECGVFAMGRQKIIGEELYGTKIGINDYSVKTTNDEGVTSVAEGAYSKRADISLAIENNKVDSTQRLLAANRATPIIYAVGNKYSSNVIMGYYKDFDITISTPAFAECSLSIEGLI